jgi:hypothetical protein
MSINEKLFRIAADHLVSQGAMSANEYDTCAYRGVSGRMCAVGVLISDDHYDLKIEGTAIAKYPEDEILTAIAVSHNVDEKDLDVDILISLQRIHDEIDPDRWVISLENKAKELGFNWTPPAETSK